MAGPKVKKKRVKKTKKAYGYSGLKHENYLNREFSWLEFNDRVLFEAGDKQNPLLERIRFLSIFTSNQDEFVMKRVGGLREQISAGYSSLSIDGLTPQKQLDSIREKLKSNTKKQNEIFNSLIPELSEQGIEILSWAKLSAEEKRIANNYFKSDVFPVLTPLSVDPGHPFPFISNLSLSLGVKLKNPNKEDSISFSRVKIPDVLSPLMKLPAKGKITDRFVMLGEIIENNLSLLFPGMEILNVMIFRVTRNADLAHDDEDAEDLLEVVEESLRERRFADCIRLEYKKIDKWMVKFLKRELDLNDDDIYEVDNLIDFTRLKPLLELDRPELKYKTWVSVTPEPLLNEPDYQIFNKIKENDILVHHPYESFALSVEKFITSAAVDPNVLAIKMTLYRTEARSPIVRALMRAANNGKQVVCLIELKARFDEQRNIYWAQKLEEAGVHVVYGILGLKTHTKISMVVRKEKKNQISTYAHIGTGNYNSQTANIYTDLSLLTSNKEICSEIIEVFNYITGKSLKTDYKKLLVAPLNMKSTFLTMIKKEIKNKKEGKPAYIYAKMNQLEDLTIIDALYEASQAGVKVDLVVRGFCCLKPGIKGLSDNISVKSIVGRFLEHSRTYFFASGFENKEQGSLYIGSADWMHRNLHNRVEVIVPILNEVAKKKCLHFIELTLADKSLSWELKNDGRYEKSSPTKSGLNLHLEMMRAVSQPNN